MATNNYMLFYHHEGSDFSNYTIIMKWANEVYGLTPIVIDLEKRFPREYDRPPYGFRSLEKALAYPEFKDLKWIWLDHRADKYWDEVELPKNNVVYCIGHDVSGFQGYEGEHKIKVRCPNKKMQDGEWYASMVAPMLLFEVYQR